MSTCRIAVIVGSLRRESFNNRLAQGIIQLAPPEFSFSRTEIGDLPLYNQDDDANPAAPVVRLKNEIRAARGILIVSPEYNRSVPGILKNALDHGSRPPAENVWAGKPAGIIGVSTGIAGTAMAQQHLRNILSYLNVPVMRQPEAYIQLREGLFAPDGSIGPGSRAFLQNWMDHFTAWVKDHPG